MCIICEKNIIQRRSIINDLILNEIVINSTKNEMIEIINVNEKTIITTKNSIRKLMTRKKHKIYIIINFENLIIINVMLRQIAY